MLQLTINSLYFEVFSVNTTTRQVAVKCRVYGDNSAMEFGKICPGKMVTQLLLLLLLLTIISTVNSERDITSPQEVDVLVQLFTNRL